MDFARTSLRNALFAEPKAIVFVFDVTQLCAADHLFSSSQRRTLVWLVVDPLSGEVFRRMTSQTRARSTLLALIFKTHCGHCSLRARFASTFRRLTLSAEPGRAVVVRSLSRLTSFASWPIGWRKFL
jgi:hypothetical protein